MQDFPSKIRYCVLGAGVHGLSTAWHLAEELKRRGNGSGADIIVLDKSGVAAGASGIACGVIRNFYVQPAMGQLMCHSVQVWEEHADVLHYRPVGYLAVASDAQEDDFTRIAQRHERMGYRAALIRGEQQVFAYLKTMFPDWHARGLTVCLHEFQGGYAFNQESIQGLARKAVEAGVRILPGVCVTGFAFRSDESVSHVRTDRGNIEVDQVIVAVGPWIRTVWQQLELPAQVDVNLNGPLPVSREMWTYWQLQEGEITVDPTSYTTAQGDIPPVIHLDSQEPLISLKTGKRLSDGLWGIYFKRDREGVQGGAVPLHLGPEAEVDPYGPKSPYYTASNSFCDYWTSGLAHCMGRFKDAPRHYKHAPSGGIGCFTFDSFPVFDRMRPNTYVIADSNHGYKMVGVGKEVARVLVGETSELLKPFRYSRFREGDLHPKSNGPFPWT